MAEIAAKIGAAAHALAGPERGKGVARTLQRSSDSNESNASSSGEEKGVQHPRPEGAVRAPSASSAGAPRALPRRPNARKRQASVSGGSGRPVASKGAQRRKAPGGERIGPPRAPRRPTNEGRDAAADRQGAPPEAPEEPSLMARLGHEVRTPLGSIIGFAELMKRAEFGPIANPRYEGYVDDILASARHALSLVDELLSHAAGEAQGGKRGGKSTSGRLRGVPHLCARDIAGIAERAVSSLRPLALEHEVNVVLETGFDARENAKEGVAERTNEAGGVCRPPQAATARDVMRIVLNLLSNAIKYTPPGGRVTVACRMRGAGGAEGLCELSITDTGPGMTPEEIARALEPYARLESTAALAEGSGLGLALCKSLCERLGAQLEIDSMPGRGTTARVIFSVPIDSGIC